MSSTRLGGPSPRHPVEAFACWALACVFAAAVILITLCSGATAASAEGAETAPREPLRIAVYDVPPYGFVDSDGSIVGISVDLWRRVAEQMESQYRLIPVSDMDAVLSGLEQGRYDVAIGAITITSARADRVDFSYPTHRSGVSVAYHKETDLIAALTAYAAAASELGGLISIILAMLVATGLAMWWIERPKRSERPNSESSSVHTLRDGLYWAVVTMTTVGYGDKTPKTNIGRIIAILWMLGSVVLVSLLSTSLVSRLTAERVAAFDVATSIDLVGKKLAAVSHSSGAEYLDQMHMPYEPYKDLPAALDALADRRSGAVVNSVGALQWFISRRYGKSLDMPQGILAPALMAFALPPRSPLKRAIDRALIKITSGADWRAVEDRFFQH